MDRYQGVSVESIKKRYYKVLLRQKTQVSVERVKDGDTRARFRGARMVKGSRLTEGCRVRRRGAGDASTMSSQAKDATSEEAQLVKAGLRSE